MVPIASSRRKQTTARTLTNLQSLRLIPEETHAASFTHQSSKGAPSAPGLHDTLRAGVGPSAASSQSEKPASAHPLEARLRGWEATQEQLRMRMLRRTYGVAEPVRRQMELKIAREGEWRPQALGGGGPSVHEDILRGREATIEWEDIFTGEESRGVVGMHDEMERKLKM
jgi:proteasome maturation protein